MITPLHILLFILNILSEFWWLWAFPFLISIAAAVWLAYVREHFKRANPSTLIEIQIPRESKKQPRAMEQVFLAIHNLRNSPTTPQDKWWDGEITLWFSFEIASFGGELHFFMRVPEKHRNMIEASFYAQYPDVELVPAREDYVDRFPETLEGLTQRGYKLFGNELILAKPDVYPIRTYIDFEEAEEERQLDPISALLETMAKIKPDESILLQILIRPVDDSWKQAGEKFITDELRPKIARTQVVSETGTTIFTAPTPGEVELLKAIERNISKPGFETVIRWLYLAPAEIYDSNFGQRGLFAAFNQYAAAHLNKFRHNVTAWTRTTQWIWPFFFPDKRLKARRERILANYRARHMPDEGIAPRFLKMKAFHFGIGAEKTRMILNTEELATIFHLPHGIEVGPIIKKSEARKIGPPAGLAIYGKGSEELPGMRPK